jgi:hypothetical protein
MKSLDLPRAETGSVAPTSSDVSRSNRFFLEVAFSVWVVVAQVWYYLQFKEQFASIFRIALRQLWH